MAQFSRQDLGLEEKHIFDEFRPLKLLGEGTFGAVWAAVPRRQQFQGASGDSVAVKFINVMSFKKQMLNKKGFLGRELAVIKVLAAEPHGTIVRSFGAFYDGSFRGDSPAAKEVGRQLLTNDKPKDCNVLLGIPTEMADFRLWYWLRRRGQDLDAKQCTADGFYFNMVPRCAAHM